MDWVETTGKSIDEATDRALAHLGVHRDDAEVEVIEEPKAGLFGRIRGEARVRARVRPSGPRPKRTRRSGGREDRPETPLFARRSRAPRPPPKRSPLAERGNSQIDLVAPARVRRMAQHNLKRIQRRRTPWLKEFR